MSGIPGDPAPEGRAGDTSRDTSLPVGTPLGDLLGWIRSEAAIESVSATEAALHSGRGCTITLRNLRNADGAQRIGYSCTCPASDPVRCDDYAVLDLLDPYTPGSTTETIRATLMPWTPPTAASGAGSVAGDIRWEVEREVRRRRVRDEADRVVRAERAADIEMPEVVGLDVLLGEPDPEDTYLIDSVWPHEANVMLAAQEKSGKSTLMSNLIRALVDGEPFLGTYPVPEPVGGVVLLDAELSGRMLRRWLRDQGIGRADAVRVASLRGRVSSFDITDAATRTRWAERIGSADVLIVDCLRPIVDALGMDENRDGSKVMSALTELCAEAGIAQWVLVHHTGHGGERARGDSGLLGTADILWRLLREDPDKPMPQPTYFTAFGRDVDVPESLLAYDPTRRRLSVAGKDRKQERAARSQTDLLDALRAVEMSGSVPPPWNGEVIEAIGTAAGMSRAEVRAGRKAAVRDGLLITSKGDRNAVLHALSDTARTPNPPIRRSPP